MGWQVNSADAGVCTRSAAAQACVRVLGIHMHTTRHESYHCSMAVRSKVWPSMVLTGSVISWNEMAQKKAPGASVLPLMVLAAGSPVAQLAVRLES